MCYRYSNNIVVNGALVNKYKLRIEDRREALRAFEEKYHFYHSNGFAHEALPVITMEKPDEIQFYQWGLIPAWVKNLKQAHEMSKMTLNATCEGVFDKPSFKGSIFTKRCLIPATGFFEWRDIVGKKYPYHIMVKDDDFPDSTRPFCFGDIYSTWVDKASGEVFNTFAIITTPANDLMEIVHNTKMRMPLILHKEDEEVWLTEGLDENHIKVLMQPYPASHMVAHTISKLITDKNSDPNVPELLEVAEYEGVEDWL